MILANLPDAPQKEMNILSSLVFNYLETKDVSFSFDGNTISNELLAWHYGILPALLAKAQTLYNKIFLNKYTVAELLSIFNQDEDNKEKLKLMTNPEILANLPSTQALKENTNFFPIYFQEDAEGLLSYRPVFENMEVGSIFVISHFLFHIIDESIKYQHNKVVDLEELLTNFETCINNNSIISKPSTQLATTNINKTAA